MKSEEEGSVKELKRVFSSQVEGEFFVSKGGKNLADKSRFRHLLLEIID